MPSVADLLLLQSSIKRDGAGYRDEFEVQWRHYEACLDLLALSPGSPAPDLVASMGFISQVGAQYPDLTSGFSTRLISLLDELAETLDAGVRLAAVRALILLRNRRHLSAPALLPLLFRLFRVPDKTLRALVFRHVVADIKSANRAGGREPRANRAVQGFLYEVVRDEHDGAARRGLAVLSEMWRRNVWRDARTVNVIASATDHPSPRVVAAALKFFLGADAAAAARGDASDDEDADPDADKPEGPSRDDVYAAYHKGTGTTKRKKQRKLKRVMAAVKKSERREAGAHENFAALQLLHDPQGFAEGLFSKLARGGIGGAGWRGKAGGGVAPRGGGGAAQASRWESRLLVLRVLSRVIGVHRLLVLNFYPFVQKYIAPSQPDITAVLASLVQACHDLVPPDALEPVLRQVVDGFVHDRARPEVATIGLKTVRELCQRTPLVMNRDLLRDLTAYRKTRDKAVSSAARALISLFRELAPSLLEKRDRGRGADLGAAPEAYGATHIAAGIDGLAELEAAEAAGMFDSDGELREPGEEGSDGEESDGEEGSAADSGDEEVLLGSDGEPLELDSDDESVEDVSDSEDEDEEEEGSEEEEEESDAEDDSPARRGSKRARSASPPPAAPRQAATPGSITQMKKELAAKRAATEAEAGKEAAAAAAAAATDAEWGGRILTEADFARIRALKHRRLVDSAMAKHGLKSTSKLQRARAVAEEDADETLAWRDGIRSVHESAVDPDALLGSHKYRRDKAERMASVLEGREGRMEFGAKSRLKQKKTGGLSNREKARRKNLPSAARGSQARRRLNANGKKNEKNFKGHVRG